MPASKIDDRIRPSYASDHKREAAAFLFSQGHGYHKTAWLLELPEATVREWLRSWKKGEFQTKLPVRQYRYTEERKQEIIAMRRRGMSWNEIYKLTGISAATIRKWMPKDSLVTTGNASHRGGELIPYFMENVFSKQHLNSSKLIYFIDVYGYYQYLTIPQ